MSVHRISKIVSVLAIALAASSCSNLSPPVAEEKALACPEGAAGADCIEKRQKAVVDALQILIAGCGASSCGPGPVRIDRRGWLVLPPAEMQKTIQGMALFAQTQGMSPQELAIKIQAVKLQ